MSVAPEHAGLSEHLNALLDGELEADLRARVEAHVAACAACRLELAQLRTTRAAVHALPLQRAPRPFTIAAPEPGAARRRGAALAALLGWGWRLGSLAAAACLIVAWLQVAAPASRSTPEPAVAPVQRQQPAAVASPAGPSVRAFGAPASSAPAVPQEAAPARASGSTPASDAASGGTGGVPPAPASSSAQGERPGRNRALLWTMAAALALASAGAFVLQRRARRAVERSA
jgi:anti-sigma factor RsiW